jgi:hypothetical protein
MPLVIFDQFSIKSQPDCCLRTVVKGKSMPSTVVNLVCSFRPWAALCCALALLLCGCSVVFGDKRSLAATVPAQSSSPANFKTTLTMSTHAIDFEGVQGHAGDQWLRISVINRGRHGFEVVMPDGRFALVAPDTFLELYNGNTTNATNSLRFPISGVQGRTPCEFQVEVSNPTQFRDAIRVYVFNSSAPM